MRDVPLPFDVQELPPRPAVNAERDRAMQRVGQADEDRRPNFTDEACDFIIRYLRINGPTSGERLTLACKNAGITPHDDRAFGPVYMRLARAGQIVKCGQVRRERGHGTAGGNVWALKARS